MCGGQCAAAARTAQGALQCPRNAEPHSPIARHILITGLVQGVGYRRSMVQIAHHLGVTGWVRNRQDGRVEACAWGSEQAVQALLDWASEGANHARLATAAVGSAAGGAEAWAAV